ncbi:Flavin containing amine oxidoreductase [compost metagenome]
MQRIAFAGEHTDALYPGTLEGALRSGQRAASQVQDLLAGKSFDPSKALPVAAAATAGAVAAKDKGGFFSRLFGGADKPEVKAAPVAKAEEVAPAPAAAPAAVTAPIAKEEPAKPTGSKAAPAKPAPAHKPAVKQAHKAEPKKATAKSEPAKKPVTNAQAKAS